MAVHHSARILSKSCLEAFIDWGNSLFQKIIFLSQLIITLHPDTDVTQIVRETGCTVLTLMGIALEKQKRDDKPVNIDQYKSMFGLLLKHSLLDKRFINTRPIGHEVSCYSCSKAANGNTVYGTKTSAHPRISMPKLYRGRGGQP